MGINYRGDPRSAEGEAFGQLLRDFPFFDGQLVTVSLAASTGPQLFQHFLNRSYRGAIILNQQLHTGLAVIAPDSVADPSKFFCLQQTTATAINALVWLF